MLYYIVLEYSMYSIWIVLTIISDAWSQTSDGAGSSHDGCTYQRTGGDTLCVETRSGVSVETFTCETTHGSRLVPQNRSWLPQVKDGDIRLRWTSLALASDGAAWSGAVNVQAWRTAHYLVSRC